MENIVKSILSVFILFMIQVSANAQKEQKKTSEMLVGTWQFDFNKSTDSIAQSSENNYSRINNETRDKIERIYSQRKLSFFSNGQLILEIAPGMQKRGNWKLLQDQKKLYIKMDNGRELNQTIEKISSTSLRLNLGGDQSKEDKRLFHKWYLNKTNN